MLNEQYKRALTVFRAQAQGKRDAQPVDKYGGAKTDN